VCRNSTYPLISISPNNPWQEIRKYCNLEDNYEPLTINSNSITSINEIPITNSASEINNGSVDIVEQKHNRLYQILNEAQRILNESKVLHNRQKFLDNMEEKLIPLNKLVEDILHHEKRRTLPRTWKD
ncbi:23135_t:CDS:2, partial [Racocetra persica]